MGIEQDLLNIKKKIETARDEKKSCELEIKHLLKTLKQEYGIEDIEGAKELLKKFKEEIEEIEKTLTNGIEKLNEALEK